MILLFTGLFLVQCLDKDADKYNVLLEHVGNSKYAAHDMIAHWTKNANEFKQGKIYELTIKAECTKVYEVREGNGKIGSPWAPEDDWYLNGQPYICNSIEVHHESTDTMDNCSDYSRDCDVCKG